MTCRILNLSFIEIIPQLGSLSERRLNYALTELEHNQEATNDVETTVFFLTSCILTSRNRAAGFLHKVEAGLSEGNSLNFMEEMNVLVCFSTYHWIEEKKIRCGTSSTVKKNGRKICPQ